MITLEELMNILPDSVIVGGAVRDSILFYGDSFNEKLNHSSLNDFFDEVNIKDIDIATSATPDEILKMFSENSFASGAAFGTISVEIEKFGFCEITTFRTDLTCGRHPEVEFSKTFFEDSCRRDLSFNALAIDKNKNLIDYHSGIEDLKNYIIKAIGNPEKRIINEDQLRSLRCCRFANRYNFKIDPETEKAIKKVDLKSVSQERIFDEINKIMKDNPSNGIMLLHKYGLLEKIIPELEKLNFVEHDPEHHPEGNPFEHTIVCLSKFNNLQFIDLIKSFCIKYEMDYKKTLAISKWCVLLHDIGKDIYNPEKFKFHGHDEKGISIAENIMKRFNVSNKYIEAVTFTVKNHMKIIKLDEMKTAKQRAIYTDPNFIYLLITHIADISAKKDGIVDVSSIMTIINKKEDIGRILPKLVTGYDVMNFGFTGKEIGKILSDIEEKQILNKITTRNDALKYIEVIYEKIK